MAYPRQLNLGPEKESELRSYLDQQLVNHEAERQAFLDKLISYQKDYWAEPSQTRKTFPFDGAANLIIPLTAIAFEAIHARSMTTLFGQKQLLTATPKDTRWSDVAPKFASFLEHELRVMKLRDKVESAIIETEKFGSGVAKTGYCRIIRYGVQEVGGVESEFPVVVKQGAEVDSVALSRFMMPFTANDPQTAAWCGEEHSSTESEIKLKEQGGLFVEGTYDKLSQYYVGLEGNGNQVERAQQNLEGRTPIWPDRLRYYEIWLDFDVAGNDQPRAIQVFYHRESGTFMSVRYNWYTDLRRPYRTGVYVPVEHRWTGVGICKQNEQFQREVTTQHRQRLDNATLANMRMIKVSKMSGYGPGEKIFPGKMWFLDDMTHVDAIQMAEIYPSSYNNEQQAVLYSQQRTGVNEVTLGMPQAGTPGTATGDLQRIQEGRRKFDYTFGNIKSFINEIVTDVACEIHQFGPRRVEWFTENNNSQLVKSVLELPEHYLRDGLLFELKLTGEQENKIVDRQHWTQISAMLVQYYTQMINIAMSSGNQQLASMLLQKALQGGTEAMKQILESYDRPNIERLLPLELINGFNSSNQVGAGGVGGAGNNNQAGLLASGPQALQQLGNFLQGSNGGVPPAI